MFTTLTAVCGSLIFSLLPLDSASLFAEAAKLRASSERARVESGQFGRLASDLLTEAQNAEKSAASLYKLSELLIEQGKADQAVRMVDRAEEKDALAASKKADARTAQATSDRLGRDSAALAERAEAKQKQAEELKRQEKVDDQNAAAYVILYEDHARQGRRIVLRSGVSPSDLKRDKTYDFGDKASSVEWKIPAGRKVCLYDDHGYRKIVLTLEGTGTIEDLKSRNAGDKISSVRWE